MLTPTALVRLLARPTDVARRSAAMLAWLSLVAVVSPLFAQTSPPPAGRSTAAAPADRPQLPETIEFNRDIRAILADNCYACHGPDKNKREAELQLDSFESATAARDDGPALVPGQPDKSVLLARVTHADPELRMPPSGSGKSLTPRQVALLRRWIEQGGKYQQHWSLIKPVRPAIPTVRTPAWVRNPVDAFVLARLDQENLAPTTDADKRTLIRRLSFDLLGLPPSPEEVDAFLADNSPQAYERLVDRLLESKHYGERMATYWLDVVRYADTAGYHSDNHRDLAPYRDYVIRAFNQNKPFDQFTIDQLAGDLLPQATNEQRIASGYNRLLQTTEEGGAQPKEYTAKYAADRVRNTSVIWLGITMGCCECHNHKFDPFTIRDFYSMQAFFADVAEKAVGRQDQTPIPTPEQEAQLAEIDQRLASLRGQLEADSPELAAEQTAWEAQARADLAANRSAWTPLKPEKVESSGGQTMTVLDDLSVLAGGANNPDQETYAVTIRPTDKRVTGLRLETLTHDSLANKSLSRANGNFVLTEVEVEWTAAPGEAAKRIELVNPQADFSQNGHGIATAIDGKLDTGWAVEGHLRAGDHKAVFPFKKPLEVDPAAVLTIRLRHTSQFAKHNVGRFRISLTAADQPSLSEAGLSPELASAVQAEPDKRTDAQKAALRKHFRGIAPRLATVREQLAAAEKAREALVKSFPMTLVTTAVAPRTVRVLPRGNWLDDSGEVVTPAVPVSLASLDVGERRATRLDFARWLTAPENPLTARVFVNRLWKLTFGQGIVKTLEDFGTQGEWPSHPELLDWLAVEFRDSGWNVKHVHKLMLMSHAYQQSSSADAKVREIDPNNRLLARQSRFRLDAEFVRDNALAISGLLSRKVGGPSVKPYQPAGYWANLNFPTREWQNDHGDNLYRRGVYTYWCRSFLHPSMLAFDAPSREECVAERPRSNTPLQALVLLNDPTYVEAARVLAARALAQGGANDTDRVHFIYRQALQRGPRDDESKLLIELLGKHRAHYMADKAAAEQLVTTGESPAPANVDRTELAAWTSVCRAVLNLHEVVTRN